MKQLTTLLLLVCILSVQAQGTWNAPLQSSSVSKNLQFSYGGYTFTDQISFNRADYNYYKGLSKRQAYSAYAIDHSSHPYLLQLAKVLDQDAKELGYTGYRLAEYLTAFVQQAIPYRTDPYNGGYDYPKYPIETIIEGGDCEDKAALLVALLNTFGFDAILVELPGHMAAAMSCSNCGGYYEYNGKKYSFIETTCSRKIGDIPYEYQHTNATILPVATSAHYKRREVTTYSPPLDNGGSNWRHNQGNNGTTISVSSSSPSGSGYSTNSITVNGVTTYTTTRTSSTSIVITGAIVTITYH
jgi:hypothetical protein